MISYGNNIIINILYSVCAVTVSTRKGKNIKKIVLTLFTSQNINT